MARSKIARAGHRASVSQSGHRGGQSASEVSVGASLCELPDELIDFVRQNSTSCEPPRKRQKMTPEKNNVDKEQEIGEQQELGHIVVKQSTWEIKCAGAKLKGLATPLVLRRIMLSIPTIDDTGGPDYIDILNNKRQPLYHASFPKYDQKLGPTVLAMRVERDSKRWAKHQGRLFTEFGLALLEIDGSDCIQLNFTVKWNVTSSPYDVPSFNSKTESLRDVLDTYFPDPHVTSLEAWSPQDFYQSAHAPNKEDESSVSMQTDEFKTNLYPFQKRAVQWLLRREGVEWSAANCRIQNASPGNEAELPVSFMKARDARGQPCFVSHLFGIVTLNVAPFKALDRDIRGGILAEEMGLGKTLEIISLISLHKRPPQPHTIFDVFTRENLRPTPATLIVSPPSILQQWISEINRHSPQLKVVHYGTYL